MYRYTQVHWLYIYLYCITSLTIPTDMSVVCAQEQRNLTNLGSLPTSPLNQNWTDATTKGYIKFSIAAHTKHAVSQDTTRFNLYTWQTVCLIVTGTAPHLYRMKALDHCKLLGKYWKSFVFYLQEIMQTVQPNFYLFLLVIKLRYALAWKLFSSSYYIILEARLTKDKSQCRTAAEEFDMFLRNHVHSLGIKMATDRLEDFYRLYRHARHEPKVFIAF